MNLKGDIFQKYKVITMEQSFQERQTAICVSVKDLTDGTYIKTDGEFTPNYLLTLYQEKLSRVNIVGVVLSVDTSNPNAVSFVLDDGSGVLTARTFEAMPQLESLRLGAIVRVIGKPREFNGSVYLIPEIVKEFTDPSFVRMRKIVLEIVAKKRGPIVKQVEKEVLKRSEISVSSIKEEEITEAPIDQGEVSSEKNKFELLIGVIREKDTGDGADVEQVIESFEGDGEKLVKVLLEEGEIFEIKPGRIKVLE